MAPTYPEGTIVSLSSQTYTNPQRGDLVLLEHPTETGATLLKRVIGLPNETVAIREGQVFIDGNPLTEPYLLDMASYTVDPLVVAEGTLFVLGDNRNNSFDSHVFGALPFEMVSGQATAVCTPSPCTPIPTMVYKP